MGGFIFSSTLVISNVVFNAKDKVIQLPKYGITKELVFYLISVVIICIFGFVQKTGYTFISVYLSAYVLYIICTFVAENMDNKLKEE